MELHLIYQKNSEFFRILIFIAIQMIQISFSSVSCPVAWTPLHDMSTCVRFYEDNRTFRDSTTACKREIAELIELDSCTKNSILREELKGRRSAYWFGLVQKQAGKVFTWNEGRVVSHFTNWNPGYPKLFLNLKSCGVINTPGIDKGFWVDDVCRKRYGRICAKAPDAECVAEMYGNGCAKRCSSKCAGVRRRCHPTNGHCLYGCAEGYGGEFCRQKCANRTYGPNCQHTCSPHCLGEEKNCDHVTGRCLEGCRDGFVPPTCDNPCPMGTYGPRCAFNCSVHCAGILKKCNSTDGVCLVGCVLGYHGSLCVLKSSPPFIKFNELLVTLICAASTLICLILAVQVLAPNIMVVKQDDHDDDYE